MPQSLSITEKDKGLAPSGLVVFCQFASLPVCLFV